MGLPRAMRKSRHPLHWRMKPIQLELIVGERVGTVDALYLSPPNFTALYVFGHGAGANMHHPFMEQMAREMAAAGLATLRYNFPFMQKGSRRPDPPAVLEATVRAAIAQGVERAEGRTLVAGGKSMGGRMTSQALAKRPDDRVAGIAFLGFPLHQPGKPSTDRAAHLQDVEVPMLFLQGTRDSLAQIALMKEVAASLDRATLQIVDDADHSFAVPKRTGRNAQEVQVELARTIAAWASSL